MEDKKLKIALIEDDKKNSESIMALFTMHKKFVDKVEKIHTKNELFQKIESDNINTVVINIFSFGISKGIEIIEKISKEKNERPIPVCLLGTKKQLASFEDVPANWIIKFKHYCKMATDESIEMLNEDIKDMSRSLLGCLKTMSKKISLEKEILVNVNVSEPVSILFWL